MTAQSAADVRERAAAAAAPATGSVPLRPGRAPRGPSPAAPASVVVALLVTALGVVGVREALVAWGLVSGGSWVTATTDALDGAGPQPWVLAVGVTAAVLGLVLLVAALRPRRRSHLAVGPDDTLWIRPADLGRLALSAAHDVSGVTSASVSTSRRKVDLHLVTTADDGGSIRSQVEQDVAALLADVRPAPRLTVRSRTEVTS